MVATTLTGDGHSLTTSSSTVVEGGLINQTNPLNDSNNYTKYSPKPFIISKERFRSASSAITPPLLSNNNTSSSTTLSNNNNNQTLPSSTPTIETLSNPPTIRDLNLPTVRKSRRKKPLTKDGETPQMSEEEYRRLMMLKRKSRFIYSSSLSTVNSRQKENSYDDAVGSISDDEVMMSESLEGGDDDFSTLFDQLEGQDLEAQFNNFLQALQGRTSSTTTFNSSGDDNSHHHDINNLISQASNRVESTMKNEGASPSSSLHKQRHSEIPRVLMEHFQKEEFEWKQQVRQLHANAAQVPDKYCQLSSFTLNNNNNGSTNAAATIGKVKNNNNIDSSIITNEQRRGHNQYNNNTFASASYSGTEGGHLHLINNNNNYSNPFYTSCSMMNENEYLQATSSTTDYSYPMFHTDDESSLMFDDDNPSPFEKLILDDDELLDYGDCDTYGEVDDEFNNMTTMDDGMTVEEPPFFESTPPLQRPVYLSLQTLPVSPLMSATITSSELQRKSSTSSGVNSPSSTKTTTNNINNALTSSDELDVFNANNSLANLNEKDGSLSASPVAIDVNRKTKVRRSSSSIPEDFNKFLQISSPQQQLFQGASSPVRALSPSTSIACSPGKGSPHHSRKLSNNGIGHVRRNSGIKKQPRTNSYTVSSILGDPQLKPLFFDFLNEHHNSELVVFLQEEEEFRSECQNCIAPNIGKLLVEYEIKIERIKQIFETYIKPGSNSELNLSNETRLKVENRVSSLLIPPVITRHKGIGDLHLSRWISPDTFEAATTEVKISLKNHILPLFLENSRFENYLVQKHIQDNTVSNLRGKKIQRMLGYYIPESAKDTFYVNGATVGLDKQQQQQDQSPQHSQQQHHYSTINDPTAKKSRPKKSLAALFGNTHQTPTQNHNNPTEPQVFPDTSPKSPFKNEQHKHQSLNKFKNWILGKRSNPSTESPNPSSSWSTLSKKSQLTVNNASNSAPQFVGSSSHIKISPREMESSDPNKVSNSFLPLTMTGGQSNTPEINSLIRDGILFIKVHTKKRGNCKILEINVDKMSMLSEQDKKLANQLKNVLLTHIDADINPFDKYPHLRDFLQTKISVQSQKNWEEINEDCIIKVKSPPTSHFFKL